ncbi:hypothetical protein AB6A40_007096 [Gnathostoma spinigerum]|uniref:Uncharacterized protein n=1 Tax=Gnathostoma spinigerum TaxID=75299 RepID=A0ABD6EUM6_9BILA
MYTASLRTRLFNINIQNRRMNSELEIRRLHSLSADGAICAGTATAIVYTIAIDTAESYADDAALLADDKSKLRKATTSVPRNDAKPANSKLLVTIVRGSRAFREDRRGILEEYAKFLLPWSANNRKRE